MCPAVTIMRTIQATLAAIAIGSVSISIGVAAELRASDSPNEARLNSFVIVTMKNGRTHSAYIDPEATQDQLWLRWENPAAVIRQQFHWSQISRIDSPRKTFTPAAFRRLLPEAIDARVASHATGASQVSTAVANVQANAANNNNSVSLSRTTPQAATVRSLAIEARAANWNADPAVDGIRLTVYPLDSWGDVIPVRGTVTAELVGDARSLRKPQPKHRYPRLSRLGWWNRSIHPTQFTAGGAAFELPFQAYDPEMDPTIRSRTLLIVRLTVPGQGTFRASLPDVWVRPFSVMRNRIETITGNRYLPQEIGSR